MVTAYSPAQPIAVALQSSLLAQVLRTEGKLDEADPLARRAVELYRERLGPDHPRFAAALKALSAIESARGQDSDALAHARQALSIDEKAVGESSAVVADDLIGLASLQERAGNWKEARSGLERALAINTAAFGANSSLTIGPLASLAGVAYNEGRYGDARQLIDRVRGLRESLAGTSSSDLLATWIFSARVDLAEGKLDAASVAIDRAATIAGTLSWRARSRKLTWSLRRPISRGRKRCPATSKHTIVRRLSLHRNSPRTMPPSCQAAVDHRLVGDLCCCRANSEAAESLRRDALSETEKLRSSGPSGDCAGLTCAGRYSRELGATAGRVIALSARCWPSTNVRSALKAIKHHEIISRSGWR